MLDADFNIAESVFELDRLDSLIPDDEVLGVWEFIAGGKAAGSRGVRITCADCQAITEPAPVPKGTAHDGEVSDDDGVLVVLGSDAESDGCKAVDTDEETSRDSALSSESNEDSDSDVDPKALLKANVANTFLKLVSAPVVKAPATGVSVRDPTNKRRGLPSLWHDEYFWICDTATDFLHVKIRREHHHSMVGLGTDEQASHAA